MADSSSLFISLQEDSFYLLDLNNTTAFTLTPPFPLPHPSHDTCLLHCGGLICLPLPDYITIWDPSTSFAKFIPTPKPCLTENLIGFGYDSVNDDYKIVMVFDRQETYIYSFKYNIWKVSHPIPNSNCVYKDKTGTVLAKNCIYWIGSYIMDSEFQDFILCFDLVQESYQLVCNPNQEVNSWLGISRGEICEIDHYPNLGDSFCKWSPV